MRTCENCPVFNVQTVQGLTLFRFIFKTDTSVQSHFHSFQLEKEPYLPTTFFSLQTKRLGNMSYLPNTSHRAAFQAAGALAKTRSLPTLWAKGRAQAPRAHVKLTPAWLTGKPGLDGSLHGNSGKGVHSETTSAFTVLQLTGNSNVSPNYGWIHQLWDQD